MLVLSDQLLIIVETIMALNGRKFVRIKDPCHYFMELSGTFSSPQIIAIMTFPHPCLLFKKIAKKLLLCLCLTLSKQ